MKTKTTKIVKNAKTPAKAEKAPKAPKTTKEPKAPALFMGKVTASRVLSRPMAEFKNCQATCWLLISEQEGVYYYSANSYNGPTPKLSWKPEDYRYDLTDKAKKIIEKKIADPALHFVEIEPTDWPAWITSAGPVKKTRKAK